MHNVLFGNTITYMTHTHTHTTRQTEWNMDRAKSLSVDQKVPPNRVVDNVVSVLGFTSQVQL
jgi:hypothetical protein